MIWQLYCVHDKIAERSMGVFQQENHRAANRAFINKFRDAEHEGLNIDHFELRFIGEFDDSTSVIDGREPKPVSTQEYLDAFSTPVGELANGE